MTLEELSQKIDKHVNNINASTERILQIDEKIKSNKILIKAVDLGNGPNQDYNNVPQGYETSKWTGD